LDGLDNEELPVDMAIHLRACPECARQTAALKAAVALYRLSGPAGSVDVSRRVAALLPFMEAPRRSISMRDWLAVGLVIFASVILVPLLAEFRELGAAYGTGFTLPVSLALGVIVTLYAGMFVMSHLDDFSKRLKDRNTHKGAVEAA
jgi:hypothetical protein